MLGSLQQIYMTLTSKKFVFKGRVGKVKQHK